MQEDVGSPCSTSYNELTIIIVVRTKVLLFVWVVWYSVCGVV